MVIVETMGGLGNQMFQYAYAKLLQKNNIDVFLSTRLFPSEHQDRIKKNDEQSTYYNNNFHINKFFLNDIFMTNIKLATNEELSLFKPNIFKQHILPLFNIYKGAAIYENRFSYSDLLNLNHTKIDNVNAVGYWQQLSLYEDIKDDLIKDFTFKKKLSEENTIALNQITSSNSVSIHVRRGDYINHPDVHPTLTTDYYLKALKIIEDKHGKVELFCFSDDIEWCKKNLPFNDINFINWNLKEDNYVDMQLMSYCKHNILANSTFSAWAAFLNNNSNKTVVSPSKFTNLSSDTQLHNFLPKDWTILEI